MLHYCKTPGGNFGDDLNPWLWPRLAPEVCGLRKDILFLGIGTVISRKVPAAPHKHVFGSGWSGKRAPRIDANWTIHCVRGPLTAKGLGLAPNLALTDPALLLRGLVAGSAEKRHKVSFMPHHRSLTRADWPGWCARIQFHCVDARCGVETVLNDIRQTELLVTESMHGAIIADALRIPWIPVCLYPGFNEFKWQDWAGSVGLSLDIARVRPIYGHPPAPLDKARNAFKRGMAALSLGKGHWGALELRASSPGEVGEALRQLSRLPAERPAQLSAAATLERLEEQLREKLQQLRAAFSGGASHAAQS